MNKDNALKSLKILGAIPLEIPSHPHLSTPKEKIKEIKKAYKVVEQYIEQQPTKEVYIIISPEGRISLGLGSGKGTCYSDLDVAEKALKSKNEWSKPRGYGVYQLVTLEVQDE